MMPHQWRLLLQPSSPAYTPRVTPAQLHGLACALFEGAGTDHHRQNKPFRVTPLIHADEGDGVEQRAGPLAVQGEVRGGEVLPAADQ